MAFDAEASIEQLFEYIESKGACTVLFVDQSKLSEQYTSHSWVHEEGEVIVVDQDILDCFQIGKIPQWRFFLQGNEVANLIGTQTRDKVLEIKNRVFENVRSL